MSCPYTEMSAWWWLFVTETRSKLYIIEYIVVFGLHDILVSDTTQRDGSYKKSLYETIVSDMLRMSKTDLWQQYRNW